MTMLQAMTKFKIRPSTFLFKFENVLGTESRCKEDVEIEVGKEKEI